jgi:hypothetical protein
LDAFLGGTNEVSGKIKVVVDSYFDPFAPGQFVTTGTIEIKKGRATLPVEQSDKFVIRPSGFLSEGLII